MKKIVTLLILLASIVGCGEPSEKEMKQRVVKVLKEDAAISQEFVDTLKIKYGNGILVFYNNCPELIKINDKRLSKEYKKKERERKQDVWGNLLAVASGDNIWDRGIRFREACEQMRYRAANLAQTLEGVKEAKVLK